MQGEIKLQIDEATKAMDELISRLGLLKTSLQDTIGTPKSNGLKFSLYETTSALKKTLNFGVALIATKKLWNTTKGISNEYIKMTETNNLFEVAMGKVVDEYGNLDKEASTYYVNATKFQDKMNAKLLTNKAELKEYQAMYFSMFNSQGINKDSSYFMSEQLTKAGYDIASLYNIEVEDAMDKLKSGLAGQVEGLRKIGIDVSESALTKVIRDAGITDRNVQQLSYAEKEVARYIAIVDQAKQAQGDFAKTMDNSANQIKVFKSQLAELKQVAGSFIVNTFGGVLVYVNGAIMALKEILKVFANLLGYDLNTGGADLSESVGIDDLDNGLGSAIKKAKELKKQFMGFDEINNIAPPSKSNNGSSGIATGVDDKLLQSLKAWDNKMDSISSKAIKVRNAILDWLGFTDGSYTNLKRMLDIAKLIGTAILGWKISKGISNFFMNMGYLSKAGAFNLALEMTLTITGFFAQYQGTKKLLSGDIDLFNILETVLGTGAGALGIAQILKFAKNGNMLTLGQRLSIGLGIMLLVQSVQVMMDGIKNDDIGKQFLGSLEAGIGAYSIAKQIGGWEFGIKAGLVFTLATIDIQMAVDIAKWSNEYFEKYREKLYDGKKNLNLGETLNVGMNGVGEGFGSALADLQAPIAEFLGVVKTSRKELKAYSEEIRNVITSYKDLKATAKSKIADNQVEIEMHKQLTGQLMELVDANGKVKKGYEQRVDFILSELNNSYDIEIERDGEILSCNGQIVKSNTELQKSIEKTIEKRKREVELEVAQELYKESLKQKIKLQNEMTKAQERYNKLYEEYMNGLRNGIDTNTLNVLGENLKEAENALNSLGDAYQEVSRDVTTYEQEMTSKMIEGTGIVSQEMLEQNKLTTESLRNIAKDNEDSWKQSYETMNKESKKIMLALSSNISDNSPVVISKWQELAKGSYDTFKENIDECNNAVSLAILNVLTETEGMTPNVTKVWQDMGYMSKEQFNTALASLPEDTRGKVLASIISVNGMNESNASAYRNLSANGRRAFDEELGKMSPDARGKVQSAINAIFSQSGNASIAGSNVGKSANRGFNSGLGSTAQSANNFLSGFILKLKGSNPCNLISTVSSLANKVVSWWNKGLGNHSPSKKTRQSAVFFAQGFTNQIDHSSSGMVKQVEEMANDITQGFSNNIAISDTLKEASNGIKVDTKTLAIDTNQYIDYGAIKGNIQAQSNLSMSNSMFEEIVGAVKEGIKDAEFNVEVVAKTEEGVIVKKATEGFKEYVEQTGELPFPVPV